MSQTRVISIGECMVELTRGADGRFDMAFGGDTFNTAVYLARAGVTVVYATALGDDPYSAGIVAAAQADGVGTDLMTALPGRMPGLYMIETTTDGERSFWYWRERAAARDLFECGGADAAVAAIEAAPLVYFSGITLSLYSERGHDVLAAALARARKNGARIAMDGNFRPRGWGGNLARAQIVFDRFWQLATIALPTFDDEQALWGDAHPDATIERLLALGVPEIAVKNGASGAWLAAGAARQHVACPSSVKAVDTTAAGDSFNAGYISRRLTGATAADAAMQGHRLAAVVIQHRGAIVPKSATDAVFGSV